MTFNEFFTLRLEGHFMADDDLEAALEYAKSHELTEAMAGRWKDNIEDYPQELLVALWMNIRDSVLEWIDANKPLAWYRPLFEEP